jgi:uncharacterized membrane protein YdbT with pleckstrin-like domain
VAFPDESLAEGEAVRLHLHPHAIAMFWPTFWALVTVGGGGAGAVWALSGGPGAIVAGIIGVVGLILFIWLALVPWIIWRSTHYVFTNKQVLIRTGVLSRVERGIPLGKINDVQTTQSLVDRILRAGTVLIESAGEKGQSHLDRVPHVIQVSNTLKDLMEQDTDRQQISEEEFRAALREHREAGGNI